MAIIAAIIRRVKEGAYDSNKHFTTYTLREKHNVGHGTVQRLQKNMPVSTYTLDRLCKILDCRLDEVAEYLPDEEAEKVNKK